MHTEANQPKKSNTNLHCELQKCAYVKEAREKKEEDKINTRTQEGKSAKDSDNEYKAVRKGTRDAD